MTLSINFRSALTSLIAGLVLLTAAYTIGRCSVPIPVPAAPLPVGVVPVQPVDNIHPPTPADPPPVEVIRWRTKVEVVEGPERIREVVQIVEKAADLGSLQGVIELDAAKFEGMADDVLTWGWRGRARFKMRATADDPWVVVVDQPLDLSSSTAITTLRPPLASGPTWKRWEGRLGVGTDETIRADIGRRWRGAGGRFGYFVGGQYGRNPEAFDLYTGVSLSWGAATPAR